MNNAQKSVVECIKQLLPNIAAEQLTSGVAAVATMGVVAGASVAATPLVLALGCVATYIGLQFADTNAESADAGSLREALTLLRNQAGATTESLTQLRASLTVLGFDLDRDISQVLMRLREIDDLVRLQGRSDGVILAYLEKHEGMFISFAAFLEKHFYELKEAGLEMQASIDDLRAAIAALPDIQRSVVATELMVAEVLNLLRPKAANSSDYPTALATVAAQHQMEPEQLRRLLHDYATELVEQSGDQLTAIRANIAAGEFASAEAAARECADRAAAAGTEAARGLAAASEAEFEALGLAALAALQGGKVEAALGYFQRRAALCSKDSDLLRWIEGQRGLAIGNAAVGCIGDALGFMLELIKAKTSAGLIEDEKSFDDRFNFGVLLIEARDYSNAEKMFTKCFRISKGQFGRDDWRVAASIQMIGQARMEQGDLKLAEQCFRRCVAFAEEKPGPQNFYGGPAFYNLAKCQRLKREHEDARVNYEIALSRFKGHLAADHLQIAFCLNDMGLLFLDEGRLEKAEKYIRDALVMVETRGALGDWEVSMYAANLGRVFLVARRFPEAIEQLERALTLRRRTLSDDAPQVLQVKKLIEFARQEVKLASKNAPHV